MKRPSLGFRVVAIAAGVAAIWGAWMAAIGLAIGAALAELLDWLSGRRLGTAGFRVGLAVAERRAPVELCGAECQSPHPLDEPAHVCTRPKSPEHHMHESADGDRWWSA